MRRKIDSLLSVVSCVVRKKAGRENHLRRKILINDKDEDVDDEDDDEIENHQIHAQSLTDCCSSCCS